MQAGNVKASAWLWVAVLANKRHQQQNCLNIIVVSSKLRCLRDI